MMERKNYLLFLWILLIVSACSQKEPVEYVDPFICTQGDHGQWLPAASVPYGMIKLCSDTYPGSLTADGDFAHSGYDYSDKQLRGISHFHLPSSGGTRIGDRAGFFTVIPLCDVPADTFFNYPVLDFDKKREKATAGYYSTFLSRENILVELTALVHTGYHRYSFPKDQVSRLYISSRPGQSTGISFNIVSSEIIEGVLHILGGIYFIMEFNSPFKNTEIWNGSQLIGNTEPVNQVNNSLFVDFGELKGKPLEIRVGISLTGMEGARKNLNTECPDWNFNKTKDQASDLWNQTLSRIEVKGGSKEDKTIFYTALFHTCFMPCELSDVDGKYLGLDREVHQADGYKHYSNYAFWDSFRTKYPLYSLFQPEVYRDIVKSLRDINLQADNFAPFPNSIHGPTNKAYSPRGKDGFQAFFTCRHEHMLMVLVDAYFKGLYDIPAETVYPIIRQEALLQLPERYDSMGYIPARPDRTGECCWDNWCVAQMADALGYKDDYAYFMKRSEYWRNTWDPSLRFFRARDADGTWLDFPEDPTINREKYTYEGTKWQWRWNVLHDVPGMIDAFGGNEAFVKELEYFFENGLYNAGNQIDLQAPFLFNSAGAPWLTQKWVKRILTEPVLQRYGTHELLPEPVFERIYKATPDGYLEEMDDDYGCMAGWYAMSAMGLYQLCPGDPVYQVTAPVFDKVIIHLDKSIYGGGKFVIRTKNLDSKNIYIQSAELNGQPYNNSWLSHKDIASGGELVFEMGPDPGTEWGK